MGFKGKRKTFFVVLISRILLHLYFKAMLKDGKIKELISPLVVSSCRRAVCL